MEGDEQLVRGKDILDTLAEFGQPATEKQIMRHINLGGPRNKNRRKIKKSLHETLERGVQMGYVQQEGGYYYAIDDALATMDALDSLGWNDIDDKLVAEDMRKISEQEAALANTAETETSTACVEKEDTAGNVKSADSVISIHCVDSVASVASVKPTNPIQPTGTANTADCAPPIIDSAVSHVTSAPAEKELIPDTGKSGDGKRGDDDEPDKSSSQEDMVNRKRNRRGARRHIRSRTRSRSRKRRSGRRSRRR